MCVRRALPTPRDAIQILLFLLLVAGLVWLVLRGAAAMRYDWQWGRVLPFLYREYQGRFYAGPLLRGLGVTLEIALAGFAVALLVGLLAAILRLSDSLAGRGLVRAYIELIRNTPLLIQIYLFYFVLGPIIGVDRLTVAILSLGLFEGAFVAEIMRAGILSVDKGQWEAATSLGLNRLAVYRLVVLPQAVLIVLPPLTGVAVNLVKHSAILSAIAIFELTNEGRNAIADTFMTFEIWLTVAALYLGVTTALSALAGLLERRMRMSLGHAGGTKAA